MVQRGANNPKIGRFGRWLCAGLLAAGTASAQPQGETITYANTSGPGTLDPHLAGNTVEIEVVNQVFEGLISLDEHYHPRPMLASKVEANADATAYTFTLRRGVRFQNGKEFTSADALASLQRYSKVSPNTALLVDLDGFDTPDPYSLVVRLKKPVPLFQEMMVTPIYPVLMVPAEQAGKPAREIDVLGTGPFRIGEWVRDSHLIIRRNDSYVPDETQSGTDGYAGYKKVQIDAVRYNFVPEANGRIAAVKAGEADIAGIVPPELASSFDGRGDLAAQTVFPGCMSVIILHAANPPTDNALVRQAIAAVIDVDDVIAASGLVAKQNPSILYPDSPYFEGPKLASTYNQHNVARAKELLKQAGYHGEKIVLQTNSTYAAMRDSMLVIAQAMKTAGMNADVQVLDWISNSNNMQRATKNWNATTSWFCSQPLLGPQQWRPIIYNYTGVQGNEGLDKAYQSFLTSTDAAVRRSAWGTAETELISKAYVIKISDFGWVYGYNRRVKGLQPWYSLRFWNVSTR